MRLRAITPIVVSEDELSRRRVRYEALAPPGVTIHLDNLANGPDRLESWVRWKPRSPVPGR